MTGFALGILIGLVVCTIVIVKILLDQRPPQGGEGGAG